MGQAVSYVAQHEAMSTQQHANRLVPKHATLIKTLVPVAGTVSRRIDPEQTELEDDSIPRPVTRRVQGCFALFAACPSSIV